MKKREMSQKHKAAISAAQKARWQQYRKEQAAQPGNATPAIDAAMDLGILNIIQALRPVLDSEKLTAETKIAYLKSYLTAIEEAAAGNKPR